MTDKIPYLPRRPPSLSLCPFSSLLLCWSYRLKLKRPRLRLVCSKRDSEIRLFEGRLDFRIQRPETSLVCCPTWKRDSFVENETHFKSSTIDVIVLDVCDRVYEILNETRFPETGIDPVLHDLFSLWSIKVKMEMTHVHHYSQEFSSCYTVTSFWFRQGSVDDHLLLPFLHLRKHGTDTLVAGISWCLRRRSLRGSCRPRWWLLLKLQSGTKLLEKINKTRIFNLNVGKQRVKTFSHTPPPPYNVALGWNFLFNIEWGRRGLGILHEQPICEK